jgi:hypothetical protein
MAAFVEEISTEEKKFGLALMKIAQDKQFIGDVETEEGSVVD